MFGTPFFASRGCRRALGLWANAGGWPARNLWMHLFMQACIKKIAVKWQDLMCHLVAPENIFQYGDGRI
jgi:hypothetical protein